MAPLAAEFKGNANGVAVSGAFVVAVIQTLIILVAAKSYVEVILRD